MKNSTHSPKAPLLPLLALLLVPQLARASARLESWKELLSRPKKYWAPRSEAASARRDPASDMVGEVEGLLKSYAPRIWWHPKERYGPMDPLQFASKSSLWYRSPGIVDEKVAEAGTLDLEELARGESGLYSRHPRTVGWVLGWIWDSLHSLFTGAVFSPSQTTPLARPNENGFVFNGGGYYLKLEDMEATHARPEQFEPGAVPMFWRLTRWIPLEGTRRVRALIEYWYHLGYSEGLPNGLGNHQGDWEGMSALVELEQPDDAEEPRHRLVATYLAAHEEGQWLCADRANRKLAFDSADRLEVYTALGSHGTYPAPGSYPTRFKTDIVERGRAWEAWRNLRPLELEPYYGYTGAWGEAGRISCMTGPLVPGIKTLPRSFSESELARACATT